MAGAHHSSPLSRKIPEVRRGEKKKKKKEGEGLPAVALIGVRLFLFGGGGRRKKEEKKKNQIYCRASLPVLSSKGGGEQIKGKKKEKGSVPW